MIRSNSLSVSKYVVQKITLNFGSIPNFLCTYSKFSAIHSIFFAPSKIVISFADTPIFRRNWSEDIPSLPYHKIAIFLL